jgi:CheY-like chemotaxis protein
MWLDLTRSALAGHQVDSAGSFREAIALIQANEPYDLALVDLNLDGGDDRLGAEILDFLRLEYPTTRRIVVTAYPPAGGLRANIFVRYGVDEIIFKGRTTLPDLRKIVTEVLSNDSSAIITQDARIDKSELTQRYRDWHTHLESTLRTLIRGVQGHLPEPGKTRRQANARTESKKNRLLLLREKFARESADFERILSAAASIPEIAAAGELLDRMTIDFAEALTEKGLEE